MQEKSKTAYILSVLMITITVVGILYGITKLTDSRTTKTLPHDLVANSTMTQENVPPPTPDTTLLLWEISCLHVELQIQLKKNFNDDFDLS